MKKTAMKISGIITLILFFLLFLVSIFNVLLELEIEFVVDLMQKSKILAGVIGLLTFTFVGMPQLYFQAAGLELAEKTVLLAISLVFCLFCLLMFLWGIKEVRLSKRDDEKFARCKKTCWFMMLTKFAFFAYLVSAVIGSVMIDEFSVISSGFSTILGVPYVYLIVVGVLTFISFLMFVLPVANILTVASAVKADQANFVPAGGYVAGSENEIKVDDSEQMKDFYSQQPAPTMQANMPPMPGFRPQMVTQSAQPQQNVQVAQPQPTIAQPNAQATVVNAQPQVATVQPASQTINSAPQQVVQPSVSAQATVQPQVATPTQAAQTVPTQPQVSQPTVQPQTATQPVAQATGAIDDPLVANLTEQGVAELQRIDRLKSIGAITEQNYAAMRQRIISSNQK